MLNSSSTTFANNATESAAFETGDYTAGSFYLPAEFNTDTITFKGAESVNGTFALVIDSTVTNGTLVSVTAINGARWYNFPAAVMAMNAVKIVTNNATSAAATVLLGFKSTYR